MVRVAALADLHCTKTSQGAFQPLFARISEAADLLLLPGDLTDYGLPEEARVLAKELTALRIPAAAVLGNHDFESDKADRGAADPDRRRADRARRRRLRAAGHRHRRREGVRRRLRPARARAVGRDDHQAVRPRGGERSAEARGGARAPAHDADRRAPALLARFSRPSKASRSRSIRSSAPAVWKNRSAAIRCRSSSTATRIAASSKGRHRAACPSTTSRCRSSRRTFPDRLAVPRVRTAGRPGRRRRAAACPFDSAGAGPIPGTAR